MHNTLENKRIQNIIFAFVAIFKRRMTMLQIMLPIENDSTTFIG